MKKINNFTSINEFSETKITKNKLMNEKNDFMSFFKDRKSDIKIFNKNTV